MHPAMSRTSELSSGICWAISRNDFRNVTNAGGAPCGFWIPCVWRWKKIGIIFSCGDRCRRYAGKRLYEAVQARMIRAGGKEAWAPCCQGSSAMFSEHDGNMSAASLACGHHVVGGGGQGVRILAR
ncbi:hypothetical protein R1flu_002108 [Riccia fluitans]|uniref:Uncharacterized protein n=1 Tax=Riccia fluitans TaxID=41844 RepID=A0ABD1Y5F8_9MARC